jgi:biopolymer transport protein ExbD
MSFSNSNSAGAPMCDINTTPLVDVMLVLLIIFMITAPSVINKTDAKVPLRSTVVDPNPITPTLLTVDVQASASSRPIYLLEGQPINAEALLARLKTEATKGEKEQADINLRTAPDARYEHMAQALALIQSSKVKKVRFDELNPASLQATTAPTL